MTGSFSSPGIYSVQFSSDWNTILSITFISNLPSNRQYTYTTPISYHITSSADSNSIISPSGNVLVDANFSQTFMYSAKSGYIIDSVLVNGSPVPITNSYTFNNVQANQTISVTSAVNPNPTITASAGTGGSISPTGSVPVNYGGSQNFIIKANTGYHIAEVFVDDASQGAISSYNFTNIQASHTITATFAINTYTMTVTQGVNGVIAPETTTVNYGGNQTFNITPNAGYSIAGITVDGSPVSVTSSSGQTVTFTNVQASHTITASFVINTFTIAASAGAGGSISPMGNVSVNYGGNQTFIITASAGYHIKSMAFNGTPITVTSPSGQTYQFSAVSADSTLTATFAINTYMITVTQSANGQISPDTSTVNYDGSQSFTITPDSGYHVASITADADSVSVSSPSGQTVSFTNVEADHKITASFAINTYNITASAGANGSISPTGSVSVNYGGSQNFIIKANTGYHIAEVFVDDASQGVVSSYNFTNVRTGHKITASFAINTYNITASAGANGSISPTGSVSVNYGGNRTFKITPNAGYYIVDVKVNGNSVGAVSSYTFTNIQAVYAISATFSLSPIIYGIAVALAIAVIFSVVLVLRKSKKSKAKTHNKLETAKSS